MYLSDAKNIDLWWSCEIYYFFALLLIKRKKLIPIFYRIKRKPEVAQELISREISRL